MHTICFEQQTYYPSKIVCIGRNYVDHIKELDNEVPDNMVVFNKPNSAISDRLLAYHQEPLHYEAELSFLYEKGKFIAVAFGLDLTKRKLQSQLKQKGLPWERAKAFDESAVFSHFVPISDPKELSLELTINGELKQQGGGSLMIYKPKQILTELATFMRLEDGDIVMTGTPKGVGEIQAGALFQGKVLNGTEELVQCEWLSK